MKKGLSFNRADITEVNRREFVRIVVKKNRLVISVIEIWVRVLLGINRGVKTVGNINPLCIIVRRGFILYIILMNV